MEFVHKNGVRIWNLNLLIDGGPPQISQRWADMEFVKYLEFLFKLLWWNLREKKNDFCIRNLNLNLLIDGGSLQIIQRWADIEFVKYLEFVFR